MRSVTRNRLLPHGIFVFKLIVHFIDILLIWRFYIFVTEMLKHSGGNYTPQQVDRCAQMSGAFGKTLDKLVTISGLGEMARHYDGQVRRHYMDDIPRFLQEYTPYGLCSYVTNRFHDGFAGFRHSKTIREPASLGFKLNVLSSRLDRWARIAQYHWTGQWTFHGCNCLVPRVSSSHCIQHHFVSNRCLTIFKCYWMAKCTTTRTSSFSEIEILSLWRNSLHLSFQCNLWLEFRQQDISVQFFKEFSSR